MSYTLAPLTRRTGLGLATLSLAALALSAAHPAAAQTTIYNFQAGSAGNSPTYTGVGALGNGANTTSTFNRETNIGVDTHQVGGGQGTVLDSNGVATTLTFKYDAGGFINSGSSSGSTDATLLQGFALDANSRNISLTGLAANTAFTAFFYGVNGNFAGQPGQQTRNTTFSLAIPNGGLFATTTETQDTAFNNPGNYVTLTGTTDSTGAINATYLGTVGGESDFNGAQFTVGAPASAAPEPSQTAGLGFAILGVLGLLWKAKKRSESELAA